MSEKNDNSYKCTKMMLNSLGWTISIICIVNIVIMILGARVYYSTNNLDFLEATFDISVRINIIGALLSLLTISCCKYIVLLYQKKESSKSQDL